MNNMPIYSAVLGVCVGLFLSFGTRMADETAYDLFDRAYPVIDAKAEIRAKDQSGLSVVMWSKKHRDCRLLEVQAFDVSPSNEIRRLQFERKDGAQPSGMPPGQFRSAEYRISPIPSHKLKLSFLHECDGRSVRTPVAIVGQ